MTPVTVLDADGYLLELPRDTPLPMTERAIAY